MAVEHIANKVSANIPHKSCTNAETKCGSNPTNRQTDKATNLATNQASVNYYNVVTIPDSNNTNNGNISSK